jgi:hypothetical protein
MKKLHTLTFARCGCPVIHWAVRGSFIGCAECRAAGRTGTFATYIVVTYNPRRVKRDIEAVQSDGDITTIIDRENATLPRGRAA